MTLLNRVFAVLVVAGTFLSGSLSQNSQPTVYREPVTGINFNTWNVLGSSGTGGLTFGMALPSTAMKSDATEFLGYLQYNARNASTSNIIIDWHD